MPLRPGDVRPGDPSTKLTADEYNRAVAAVRGALGLSVAPPLTLRGRTLGLERRDPFWATLSGSGSPYSFVEAADTPTVGTWAAMPRAGTTNAYEANGVSGLAGKRVLLRPGAAGDYRFQWVADGSGGSGPPSGCGCSPPSVVHWTRQLTNAFTGITYVSVTTMTYAASNTVGCGALGAGWLGPLDAFPAAATAPGPPYDPPVTERYVFMQFYCTGTTPASAGFRLRFVTGSGSTLPCTVSGEWSYSLDPATRNTCSPFFLIDRTSGANFGVITG